MVQGTSDQNRENFQNFLKNLGNFLVPILYLIAWCLFLKFSFDYIHIPIPQAGTFLILSFLIFLFTLITRSTLWSIGHEKFGIKGDSRSRVINFHRNQDSWFDLFADNSKFLENDKMKTFIKDLISQIQ